MKHQAIFIKENKYDISSEYSKFIEKNKNMDNKEAFKYIIENNISKYLEYVTFDNIDDREIFISKNIYDNSKDYITTQKLMHYSNSHILEMIHMDIDKKIITNENMIANLLTINTFKIPGNVLIIKTLINKVNDKYVNADITKQDIIDYILKKYIFKAIIVKPNGSYQQKKLLFSPQDYFNNDKLNCNYISFCDRSFCNVPLNFYFLKTQLINSSTTIKSSSKKYITQLYNLDKINKVAIRLNNIYTLHGDVVICKMYNKSYIDDLELDKFKMMLDISWGNIVLHDNIIKYMDNNIDVIKKEINNIPDLKTKIENSTKNKLLVINPYEDLELMYNKFLDKEKLKKYLEKKYICTHCYRVKYDTIEELLNDTEHKDWCIKNKKIANIIVS